MPNRFDQPAEAQFVNTYVPIPFQELQQAGLAKQQQFNVGQQRLDIAQAEAEQLKYIADSQDEQYIKNEVIGTVNEIADEFEGRDYSDPTVMRSINKRLRTIDKQRVDRIQQSAASYGQFQQDVRKLGLQGKDAPYLNQFDPSQFSSEFGTFTQTPEARLDYKAAAESYFNNMAEKYLGTIDVEPGIKGIVHGIPDAELVTRAGEIAGDYMNSPDGRQHAQQFLYMGATEEEIPALMQDYIINIAREKGKSRVTSTFADPSFKAQQGLQGDSFVPGTLVSIAGTPDSDRKLRGQIQKVSDLADYTIGYTDEKGKKVSSYRQLAGKIDKWLLGNTNRETLVTLFGEEVIDRMDEKVTTTKRFKSDEEKDVYNNLTVKAADYNNIPVEEILNLKLSEQDDIINSYLKDFQTKGLAPDLREITNPDKSEWLNNVVLAKDKKGNILASGREWYDPTDPIGTFKQYNEITKEFPPSENEYFISHELNDYNPIMESGYSVQIIDKESGQPVKEVYMSGPTRSEGGNTLERSKEQAKLKHSLYNQMFTNPTGRVLITDTFKGQPFLIEGTSLNAGKINLSIKDANNNTIGVVDINNPGQSEQEAMMRVENELQAIFSEL